MHIMVIIQLKPPGHLYTPHLVPNKKMIYGKN